MWGGYKFTLPVEDILVKSISRTDQIVELSLFCFALSSIFLAIFKRIILKGPILPKLLFKGSSFYIVCFYLIALLSCAVSAYPYYSLFRAGQFLILIFLIGYLLEEGADFRTVTKAIYYFSVINLIYIGIAMIAFKDIIENVEGGRLSGGGLFKADFGFVPFVASVFSFCYMFITERPMYRFVNLVIFSLSVVLISLYETRIFLYSVPFNLVFLAYFYRKKVTKSYLLIFSSVIMLIIVGLLYLAIIDVFVSREGFSSSRFDTWQIILENLSLIPFWGFGFLGTPNFLLPIQVSLVQSKILITADPHNFYLAAYTEFGLLGFIFSLGLMFKLIRLVIRSIELLGDAPENLLLPGLISIASVGIINSVTSGLFIVSINFSIIAIITSIILLDRIVASPEMWGVYIKHQYSYKLASIDYCNVPQERIGN